MQGWVCQYHVERERGTLELPLTKNCGQIMVSMCVCDRVMRPHSSLSIHRGLMAAVGEEAFSLEV